MICKKCGAEIGDFASFCTYCGTPVGNPGVNLGKTTQPESENNPPPGYSEPIPRDGREPDQQPGLGYIPDYNRTQTGWQNPISGYIPGGVQIAQPPANGTTWNEIKRAGYIIGEDGRHYNIGWLKFILYVQLFVSALYSLINAITFFTGFAYNGFAEWVYDIYPGLYELDIFMGVFSVALCVMPIVTRFMLTGLKRIGPWLYLGLCLANFVISVLYLAIFSALTNVSAAELLDVKTVSSIITNVVMIVVNFIYFKHRSAAFIN